MKEWITFSLLLFSSLLAGQLEVKIIDGETKDVLIGAYALALSEGDTSAYTSNEYGVIEIASASYPLTINVSYLGYQQATIIVNKEVSEFTLEMAIDELNIAVSPTIIANPFLSNDVSFSRKEFQVLPGAYEDPSRLLLKAPGFATSNDQANSILYKGMPSQFVNWNINNALVVNPNHLSNAGTLSDVSSANAGGVNAISGQVIGSYDFTSAPYETPGTNAIAGNSNVVFSNFNNNYLNLSLVGLEAGLAYKGVQLNYRYSTVGILTGPLGLDFGGENIVYQDLFSKVDIINKSDEKLSVFLLLGKSFNHKGAVENLDSAQIFKDAQDIKFDSELIISGVQYSKKFNQFSFNGSLNFSAKEDTRRASDILYFSESDTDIQQQILSSVLEFKKGSYSFGMNWHYIDDTRADLIKEAVNRSFRLLSYSNFNAMPFARYEFSNDRIYLSAGSGISYNTSTSNFNLEPHLKVIGFLNEQNEIELSARRNTQILNASSFSYAFEPEEVIGSHFDVYYRFKQKKYTLYANAFLHYMENILVENGSAYSQFTGADHPLIGAYTYEGTAISQGVSLGTSTRNLFLNGLSFSANATFFDAKYGEFGENIIDNTFDFDRSINLFASYDVKLSKDREWITSISFHRRGGLKEFPLATRPVNGGFETIYSFRDRPTATLADYTRMDFRLVYNLRKGSHRKFAKSISLDIQNIGNRENDGFSNIDFLTGEVYIQKQLGLIPVLAYRIEF